MQETKASGAVGQASAVCESTSSETADWAHGANEEYSAMSVM
jgi:hypothetical protein